MSSVMEREHPRLMAASSRFSDSKPNAFGEVHIGSVALVVYVWIQSAVVEMDGL